MALRLRNKFSGLSRVAAFGTSLPKEGTLLSASRGFYSTRSNVPSGATRFGGTLLFSRRGYSSMHSGSSNQTFSAELKAMTWRDLFFVGCGVVLIPFTVTTVFRSAKLLFLQMRYRAQRDADVAALLRAQRDAELIASQRARHMALQPRHKSPVDDARD